MMECIKKLTETWEKTTQGPYTVEQIEGLNGSGATSIFWIVRSENCPDWNKDKIVADMILQGIDAEFIAQAHEAVPRLMKYISELETIIVAVVPERDELKKRIQQAEAELEQHKKAFELACSYNLSESCPIEEVEYAPKKCSGEMCSGAECIACRRDYFLSQAKEALNDG